MSAARRSLSQIEPDRLTPQRFEMDKDCLCIFVRPESLGRFRGESLNGLPTAHLGHELPSAWRPRDSPADAGECGSPLPLFHAHKSASRRRAEAALWRAAKAEGLAQSKTWRAFGRFRESAPNFVRTLRP